MKKLAINGKMFSVACNWRAIEEFAEEQEINSVQELGKVAEMSIAALPRFMWLCIREGEKLDGRDMELTLDDIKDNINMSVVAHFMAIFRDQSSFDAPGRSGQTKKKARKKKSFLSRIFGR